jgi:hypothetical protein
MASITQTIPNYIQGISEQPDELKSPGQLTDAVNVVPDITRGLVKRPGSKLVAVLGAAANSAGCWFSYYRDEDEQYIGKVSRSGNVDMWKCSDGSHSSTSNSYLSHSNDGDLQFLTINDYTYVTNRNTTVTMSGTSPSSPDSHAAYIELKQAAAARQYGLDFYTNGSGTSTTSSATRLHASKSSDDGHSLNDAYESAGYLDGSCPDIGTKLFNTSVNSGTDIVAAGNGSNLCFRLTVKGVTAPRGSNQDVGHGDDYTCTYQYQAELLHGGEGWSKDDTVKVKLGGKTYLIQVKEVQEQTSKRDIGAVRPIPTAFDAEVAVSASSILGSVRKAIDDLSGMSATIIGNGIYVTRSSAFNIGVTDPDLFNIVTSEINDVAKLPTSCKHGYIVKVNNSDSDSDDYHLKFKGNNDTDGPGSWIECAEPGIATTFDAAKMPHRIVRQSAGNFTVDQPAWVQRLLGSDKTNSKPSIVDKKIQKVLFWRNRLALLSGENVLLSKPGDFHNFWNETALAVTPIDRIDISCSSTFPTDLVDGIESNSGLILFSANQQFLLTTDSDLLTPDTAKINSLCTYNYNTKQPPISLGTTYGFVDNAGKYSRFFELVNVRREGEPTVLEQSKVVSQMLPPSIDRVTNSRENSYVMFGVAGTKDVYGYRYFNSGKERLQQAWFKWKLSHNLNYHYIMDDTYYAILSDGNLLRYRLKDTDGQAALTQDETYYPLHLDNWVTVGSGKSYSAATNKTTFSTPSGIDTNQSLAVFDTTAGDDFGRYAAATVNGSNIEIDGDWSNNTFYLGYNFEMSVEFPKFYVSKTKDKITRSDVHASLTIHRVKLDLGNVGVYQTTLKRKGRSNDYTQTYECSPADAYEEGTAAFLPEKIQTVAVYDRNINLSLFLKSTHPSPATLYSLTWEGDYNPKYYKRV